MAGLLKTISNIVLNILKTALERSRYGFLRIIIYLSMISMVLVLIICGDSTLCDISFSVLPEDSFVVCKDIPFVLVMILLVVINIAVEKIYKSHISDNVEQSEKNYAFMGMAKDVLRIIFAICYGCYALNAVMVSLSGGEITPVRVLVGSISLLALVIAIIKNIYEMNLRFARELFAVNSRCHDINGKRIYRDAKVTYYGREYSVNLSGGEWYLLPEINHKIFTEADKISLEDAVADVNARVMVIG